MIEFVVGDKRLTTTKSQLESCQLHNQQLEKDNEELESELKLLKNQVDFFFLPFPSPSFKSSCSTTLLKPPFRISQLES